MQNPRISSPIERWEFFLLKRRGTAIPMSGRVTALRSTSKPSMAMIHAVKVVPMFAPIMTPTA